MIILFKYFEPATSLRSECNLPWGLCRQCLISNLNLITDWPLLGSQCRKVRICMMTLSVSLPLRWLTNTRYPMSLIFHIWIQCHLMKSTFLSFWPLEMGMTVVNRWVCSLEFHKTGQPASDVVKYNLSSTKGNWQLKSSVDLRNRVLTLPISLLIFSNNTTLTQLWV